MIDDFKRPDERKPARIDGFHGDFPRPNKYEDAVIQHAEPGAPAFRTPEAASHQNNLSHPSDPADLNHKDSSKTGMPADHQNDHLFLPPLEHHQEIAEHASQPKKPKGRWSFWPPRKPDLTKKQWVIAAAAAVFLIGGGAAFALTREQPQPVVKQAPVKKVIPPPAPKPILSPLTGLVVTKEQQARPVTGVMIENSPDSRPQSGLDQSGVVFEAIAEYGVTRFLALYQENNPAVVGPVRSARPYYLDFAMTFDAGYAHVGGSPDALQRIKEIGVKDLDQFFNSTAYRRESSRFAPHNVYTSMDQLLSLSTSKGWTSSTFTPFARKTKEEPSKAPTAKTIDFAISGAQYNVHYDYDPAKNSYNRSQGGAVHIDNQTQAQLSPKVVVALAMPYSLMADGYHSQYQTTGTGSMIIFQDGIAIPGTWTKADTKSQFVFKDAAGAEIKLNPGQTWVTLLGDIAKATHAP
jgi:hypothetical protein